MKLCVVFLAALPLLTAVDRAAAQTITQIENELNIHIKNINRSGNYTGDFDQEKLDTENRLLRSKILKYGQRLEVLKYRFPKLTKDLVIATSMDGKFRVYPWDMQTGGTMHDYAAVFQYQGKSGRVYAVGDGGGDDSGGPFYLQVFQVSSTRGPIYLVTSNSILSGTLSGQSLDAMRIIGEKLERNANVIRTHSGLENSVGFMYDSSSVDDQREYPVRLFTFNEAKKEFRFPVVIEDRRTPQGRVTKRYITYRFDGKYFVRVR